MNVSNPIRRTPGKIRAYDIWLRTPERKRVASDYPRGFNGRPDVAWWWVLGVRRLASAVGIVDGTPANVDALLAANELVLVLPGGLREALKPRELRYRLLWGNRYGFVKAAMRNAAPLVPLASLGGDDLFNLVGNAFACARRLHLPFPLPRPAHLQPVPHIRAGSPGAPTSSVEPLESWVPAAQAVRHRAVRAPRLPSNRRSRCRLE